MIKSSLLQIKHKNIVSVQQPHLLCYQSGENAHLPQVNSAFRPPCCRVYGAAERFKNIYLKILLFLLFGAFAHAQDLSTKQSGVKEQNQITVVKGSLGIEGSFYPQNPQFEGQKGGGSFNDSTFRSFFINPEVQYESGAKRIMGSFFFRLEDGDSQRTHFDIREFYYLITYGSTDLRVGAGKEFWGSTESRHLVDIINQTDLVEDIDEESKLGQPMINLNHNSSFGELRFFILPYFRTRTFPGTKGRLRPPLPIANSEVKFDSKLKQYHPDIALRYRSAFENLDIGVSTFYGTAREPGLLIDRNEGKITPHYQLISQQGIDIQYTLDNLLFKSESIYRGGEGRAFFATVTGIEYTSNSVFDTAYDIGLLFECLYDKRGERSYPTPFQDDMFAGARFVMNDKNSTELLSGITFDRHNYSRFYNLEFQTRLYEKYRFELVARIFAHTEDDIPITFFKKDDYIQMRITRFF
jgi:hypothetical protein